MNTRLPNDYKELIELYGVGFFDGIAIWSPFSNQSDFAFNLPHRARRFLDDYAPYRPDNPEDFPYPIHPEADGILEWAGVENGAKLCWLTRGTPDSWPIVVWDFGYGSSVHQMGCVDFLVAYLESRIDATPLSPVQACTHRFEQVRELTEATATLTPTTMPYEHRIEVLGRVFSTLEDSGDTGWQGSNREQNFRVSTGGWGLSYLVFRDKHQLTVTTPPSELSTALTHLTEAARGMECGIVEVLDVEGNKVGVTEVERLRSEVGAVDVRPIGAARMGLLAVTCVLHMV